MAETAKSVWDAFVNANVNANGTQAITGAIMNQTLIDLSDSILWGDYFIAKQVAVSSTGTTVAFLTPLANINYTLVVRIFNALGEQIGYTIDPTQLTVNGFHVLPAVDGLMDYFVLTNI